MFSSNIHALKLLNDIMWVPITFDIFYEHSLHFMIMVFYTLKAKKVSLKVYKSLFLL